MCDLLIDVCLADVLLGAAVGAEARAKVQKVWLVLLWCVGYWGALYRSRKCSPQRSQPRRWATMLVS